MSGVLMLLQNPKAAQTITTTVVSYNSTVTLIAALLVVAWLVWTLVQWRRRSNLKRRKPAGKRNTGLKQAVRSKEQLSAIWLRRGASKIMHAIGIGKLADGTFCIQVFVSDLIQNAIEGPGGGSLPPSHRGIPIVLIAMPQASFITAGNHFAQFSTDDYRDLIRAKQEVIMGGISGANTNLAGECGTIGYFCRKKSVFSRQSEIYLLSNSHVFADLRKPAVDEHDLIMQPSPGEPGTNRPIAELTAFAHPKLENDTNDANFVDAAIAKLWKQEVHKPVLPMIGTVNGFVNKEDVEVGEPVRKFGRTTGFTSGSIFSTYLDIWVKYDRTGEVSFFKDQLLIEPDQSSYTKFVDKGDSGSLLVDSENNAAGLIFAGANGDVEIGQGTGENKVIKHVSGYGVANPISEVLKRLNIELL